MTQRPPVPFTEIGLAGSRTGRSLAPEEFLTELTGECGRRTYREMAENSPVIGAMRTAVKMLARRVQWAVEPSDTATEEAAADGQAFLEEVRDDMAHTWSDFIDEALDSTTVYGWSYFELVFKRRLGPERRTSAERSQHTDGRIGLRKIALRPASTLAAWVWDEAGGIQGMRQRGAHHAAGKTIPIGKALHFVIGNRRHPEGRSSLRNAYRPYFKEKHLDHAESVAIDRELNGLPVASIPSEYFSANATTDQQAIKTAYEQMVRDVRFNEQAGLLLPSDRWRDSDGNPTDHKLVELELLSANGTRAIDVDKVLRRLQHNIAMVWLADFVLLGMSNTGSWALSRSKVHLFATALEGWLQMFADTINRHLVPRLWALNNLPVNTMPRFVPAAVLPDDPEEVAAFVQSVSRAGINLMDPDTENRLRQLIGLPDAPADEEVL